MSIPAEAYLHEDWLHREMASWFSDQVFVDLSVALAHEGAWNAFPLGRRQLIVRRTASGLRAHDNVCLHRSAQLMPHGRGEGPLRCGYHGWRYDDEGQVVSTPMLLDPCLTRRQLAGYSVGEEDGLVWMSPTQQPSAVPDVADLLDDFQVETSRQFHHDSLDHAANWKLLVENVVEGYHLSFVHRDSFVPAGFTSTAPVTYRATNAGSSAHTRPQAIASRPAPRALSGAIPGYLHAYLFPNVFLSQTNGLVLFVSHFHPVAADRTLLKYSLLATPLLQAQRPAVIEHVQAEAISFTDRVLREDLALLEASQRGLAAGQKSHQLQTVEPRILHFHEHYRRRLAC